MFGRRITLLRMFGTAIRVDLSWLIVSGLLLWTLAIAFFPAYYPGLDVANAWYMAIVGSIGLVISLLMHEAAHLLVARYTGVRIHDVVLFVFGGVAELEQTPPGPRAESLMAAAGPVSNFLLAAVFYLVLQAGVSHWPEQGSGVFLFLSWVNLVVGLFNLVPAYPLDGGRMLRAFLWNRHGSLERATHTATAAGSGLALALMLVAAVEVFRGDFLGAMWWFLIGLFLRQAATASYDQAVVRTALEGEPVSNLMTTNPIAIDPSLTLRQFVDEYMFRFNFKAYPLLAADQQLTGCITTRQVRAIPRANWDSWTVGEVARNCPEDATITPDGDALSAIARMARGGRSRLLVVENGRLLGAVTYKDLMDFLAGKLELEGKRVPSHMRHAARAAHARPPVS